MKKGYRKIAKWPAFEFDKMGTDVCYILAFLKRDIKFRPDVLETAAGIRIKPGDVILHLGGDKTSAGFSTIWFDDDKGLVYEGIFQSLDGEFICFSQLKNYKKVQPVFEKYKALYFAFIDSKLPGHEWLFTNQVGAGRIVETTKIKLRKEPYDGSVPY